MQRSNRQIVKAICDDLVKIIDNAIQTTHNSGFSEIEQELPVNFNINGMERNDAQTLIYSELIQIYLDKGYVNENVGVEFAKGNKAVFHVSWINGMDDDERQKRKKIIETHIWKCNGRKRY